MPSRRNRPRAWPLIALSATALAAAAIVVALIAQQDAREAHIAASTYVPPTQPPSLTPLTSLKLPEPGDEVVFIGDSWTGGYAAEPSRKGFMWLTGDHYKWDYSIYYMSGSGYLNDGQYDEGTYLDRLGGAPAVPDAKLVFIQGSVNDGGENLDKLTSSATAVVDAVKLKYPKAQVVLVGPAPLTFPVGTRTKVMSNILWTVAANERAAYVSMVSEKWITAANFDQYMDVNKASHPTTTGHAYLAERLIADLDKLGSAAE